MSRLRRCGKLSNTGSVLDMMQAPFESTDAADTSKPPAEGHVRFVCLSRKLKFDVPTPPITLMGNGRYVMRAPNMARRL
jgi:hypothetical protein